MDYKIDPYMTNPGDMFDIPAAEQEITVASNEQTVVSTIKVSPSALASSASMGSLVTDVSSHSSTTPVQTRPPRFIMVQRAGHTPGSTIPGSPVPRPALKTVKIITVPGQGAGGKPLKAAVIPMHMLQRSVKVVSSGGFTTVPATQPGTVSFPRVLTIRAPTQLASGSTALTGTPSMTSVRPGTLILSNASGITAPLTAPAVTNYSTSEDIENSMLAGSGDVPGLLSAPSGSYYDLATGYPASTMANASNYAQPTSPTGPESGDEQEQMPTSLKTNGLRRYARCVCNKVKEKGITSYSEVADELVHEYAAEHPMIPSEQLHYIQKNIRRRVYDALNVLMALNVLQKEKKEIRWVGLPINMVEECRRLEEEREKCQISLRNKTSEIQDLILQLIAFKNLIMRNRINDRYRQSQSTGSSESQAAADGDWPLSSEHLRSRTEKIPLPFLVISTHRKTVIDCNISSDKLEYLFNFDQAFEIRDEVDTLKRMGLMLRLGTLQCTQEEYNQCLELVPPSLRFYVEAIYERRQAIVPDFEALHQQRRLFVEARLAAAAVSESQSIKRDEPCDRVGSRIGGMHTSQSMDHEAHHYNDGLYGDAHQLYADDSHLVSGTGVIPGDTQHYARAAASRGYVVPGGPGGLLRHRQPPGIQPLPQGAIRRQFQSAEPRVSHSGQSLIRSVGENNRGSSGRTMLSGDDLLDPDDDMMDDPGEDEDDDDEDMEEV